MLSAKLTEIGLSEKEAKLYLTLLKYGEHPISFLSNKADVSRGAAYQAAHSLVEYGLATKKTDKKVQVFSPLPASKLIDFIEQKQLEQNEKQKRAEPIVQKLKALKKEQITRPTFQYYHGVEGVRAAVEDTLKAQEKLLRTYQSTLDLDDFIGSEYWSQTYTRKRIDLGYKLQSIQSKEKDAEVLKRPDYHECYGPSRSAKRDVRYLEDLAVTSSLVVYDDKSLIMTSKREGFALIINSKEFADMQKNIFDTIFNTLEFHEHD